MFQTKNFLSIVASMVNRMRTGTTLITDFSVGGVARTMVEAPAQEIDELYQQMVAGLVEAVPVSVYRSFNFSKLAAAAAGGLVRVSITPQTTAIVIAAGASLNQPTSSVLFTSTADCVIPADNSYGDVPAVAVTAGSATNVPVNTAWTLAQPPAGFLSAVNLVAFINGRDLETAPEQKTRFNEFIETIARATPSALRYGAKDKAFLADASGNITERVAFVAIDEPYVEDPLQPVALVDLYVHNGVGSTSAALVARVAQVIYGYYDATGAPVPGYKAAGVKVNVTAAAELDVAVTATLAAATGYSKLDYIDQNGNAVAGLITQVTDLIAAYILALVDQMDTCVMAEVVAIAMAVPGVTNFRLAAGVVDVTATISQKLMPGTIAIT